jgi:cytochrome P450
MVDAFTQLISDVSMVGPKEAILRMINPFFHYSRWRMERFVDNQMKSYIEEKRASRRTKSKSESSRDIVDLALDADKAIPTSVLVDQLKTFFFAGHDTTATTVTWAYYFLSKHPSDLLRMRKEHDEVFGRNTTPAEVASRLIADPKLHLKLDFTLAVIKESLRLQPPASTARQAPTQGYYMTTSTGRSLEVPEGAMAFFPAMMLHRNAKVWGEDADKFVPERFMPGHTIPWGYLPFGKRPRDCIGSSLAYLESKIILALSSRAFEFEPTIEFYRTLKGTVFGLLDVANFSLKLAKTDR